MVEQLVAFALGFSICGLIGLAFLPLVSARARRLTLKRIEERLPMTFDEIEADRDLLRARYAVEKRELETAVDRERQLRAGDSAELGRRVVEIARLEEQLSLAGAQLEERNGQMSNLLSAGEALQAELSELRDRLAAREDELRRKAAEFDDLAKAHQAVGMERDQVRSRWEEAEGRNEAFEARRERLLAKIDGERQKAEQAEAEARALRERIDQGGGVEMADLRAAILEIGRKIAAQDRP